MAQFSRRTILAATDLLENAGHAAITRFLLEHGLENDVVGASMRDRANSTARYLIHNPDQNGEEGENLSDSVVQALVNDAVANCTSRALGFDGERFAERYASLNRALERDGFTVENGELRRTLPAALDLPAADDEVHSLLDEFQLEVAAGHLNQAITAHARGDWAAANAQLRAFVEALFDGIAQAIGANQGIAIPATGNPRRIWLAQLNPPFLLQGLNEWTGQGTGFLEAFFRRLHPQGAHPGLSDEEDSTFRLHLVLLTARSLMKRLQGRIR
jgi:hypothetical protein